VRPALLVVKSLLPEVHHLAALLPEAQVQLDFAPQAFPDLSAHHQQAAADFARRAPAHSVAAAVALVRDDSARTR
jgi:hypothetical protein